MPNHITNQINVDGASSIQDIMKVVGIIDDLKAEGHNYTLIGEYA